MKSVCSQYIILVTNHNTCIQHSVTFPYFSGKSDQVVARFLDFHLTGTTPSSPKRMKLFRILFMRHALVAFKSEAIPMAISTWVPTATQWHGPEWAHPNARTRSACLCGHWRVAQNRDDLIITTPHKRPHEYSR